MTTSDDAALRVSIEDCFKRTKMQQEGDTELFDTQLTIDNIMQLITQHTATAVQAAENKLASDILRQAEYMILGGEVVHAVTTDNIKNVVPSIKQLQAGAGRSGEQS